MFGGGGGGSGVPPSGFGQPTMPTTTASTTAPTPGLFGQPASAQNAASSVLFGNQQASGGFSAGSSSSPFASSETAFGSHVTLFGQPTSSTSTLFGSRLSSGGQLSTGMDTCSQSGAFGAASSTTPAAGLSQLSGATSFGTNPASSVGFLGAQQSSMFASGMTSQSSGLIQTSAGSTTQTGNAFGSGPLFGTGFGTQPSSSSGGLFGTAPAAPVAGSDVATSGTFGVLSSNAGGSMTTPPDLAGSVGNPGRFGAAVTSSAPTLFGQSSASVRTMFAAEAGTVATSEASAPMFGRPAQNQQQPPAVLLGKSEVPVTLFGKAVPKQEPPSSLFGKSNTNQGSHTALFGKPATEQRPPAVVFRKPTTKQGGEASTVFGKHVSKADEVSTPLEPAALFGKPVVKQETAEKSAAPTVLFGKEVKPKEATGSSAEAVNTAAASLFGKSLEKSEVSTSLFGKTVDKDDSSSAKRFGKPVASFPESKKGVTSTSSDTKDDVFSEPSTSPPVKSMFAQPTSPHGKKLTSEAARRTLTSAGLFGKPTSGKGDSGQQWLRQASDASAGKSSPRLERLSSLEERQELTSLLCTDVPDGYNEREILRAHFQKFGPVLRVSCNRRERTASVKFADHASADAAKKRGARVHPKLAPMSLFFRRAARPGELAAAPPSRAPPPLSAEVADELSAMSETGVQPRVLSGPRPKTVVKPKRGRSPAAPSPAGGGGGGEPAGGAPLDAAELRATLRQPAATAAQRYRALDASDKLQRAASRRAAAGRRGPLVGTCADMCPEKERYMREEKHQISAYERDHSGQGAFEMDHRLAVKQYSRSSADQEEPLPHELRTPAALLRTMDYLVTHVTDAPTADTGDWFHFIWDRTRGVRKDITQQQLSDVASAELVERCARFHVHCASALCQLSADLFDQKINNENLTKCLQTLKHMYADLAARGVRCPHEAEFRAYDILLNLNQGDTLREVQTLSEAVRRSAPVQRALRLHLALSSNNYVRFFKLVRGADYLSSCILQRYFAQVRTRALDIITLGFTPPKKLIEYPLLELQWALGFESAQECASFLRLHGLESEEGVAFLERALYSGPDAAPPLRRCAALIDAKRTSSIGEVIQGGPLPADPLLSYTPQSSFDERGLLRAGARRPDAAPRLTPPPPDPSPQPTPTPSQDAAPEPTPPQDAAPQPQAVDAGVRRAPPAPTSEQDAAALPAAAAAEAAALLAEVAHSELRRLCTDQLAAERALVAAAEHTAHLVTLALTDDLTREVCRSTIHELEVEQRRIEAEEQRRREQEQQHQQIKQWRLSAVLTDMLVAEVCLEETHDLALDEMRAVVEQRDRQLVARVSESVCAGLVRVECAQLAREVAAAALQAERRAAALGRRAALRRALRQWRETAAAGRRLRRSLCQFPAAPPAHGERRALQLMGGDEPDRVASDHATDASLCRLLLEDRLHTAPLLLATLVESVAAERQATPTDERPRDASVRRSGGESDRPHDGSPPLQRGSAGRGSAGSPPLQRGSAGRGSAGSPPLQRGLTTRSGRVYTEPQSVWKVALLAMAADDPLSEWLQHKLSDPAASEDDLHSGVLQRGTAAALTGEGPLSVAVRRCRHPDDFLGCTSVVTSCGGPADGARAAALLRRLRREPLLPLAVLTLTGGAALAVRQMELLSLSERGPLATYRVFEMDAEDAVGSGRTLAAAVTWLWEHRAATPPLLVAPLRHLVADFVGTEVTGRLYRDLHHRRGRRRVEQRPEAMIALYNSAVRHLAAVVSSSSLPELSWPPPEMVLSPAPDWNRPRLLLTLKEMVEDLTLPCLELEEDWDWADGCARVMQYIKHMSLADGEGTPMMYRVHSILRERVAALRATAGPDHQPSAACLPWTDIVQCCVEQRLCRLSDPAVCCLPDELAHFRLPQLWTDLTSSTCTNASAALEESVAAAKRPLERSVADSASKRRLENVSLPAPSLDVSAELSRELDVSLDWEQRLRDIVDQGSQCEEGLPLPSISAAPATPPRRLPPLATSRLRADDAYTSPTSGR